MQAWGAPQDEIDQVRASLEQQAAAAVAQDFPVFEENRASVAAFTALSSQWRYAGETHQRIGLDYGGVTAWLGLHSKPRRRRALFSDLQTMEWAVLQADRELREQQE